MIFIKRNIKTIAWIIGGILFILTGIYPVYIRPIIHDLPKGNIEWMWIFIGLMYFGLANFYYNKEEK